MALHLRSAVRTGLARVASRNGLVLLAVFLLVTAIQNGLIQLVGTSYVPVAPTAPATASSSAPSPGTSLPPLIAFVATFLVTMTGGLLTIPARVIAIRTFVSDRTDRIPDPFIFHQLGWASLRTFLCNLLISVAGFLTLIVPVAVTTFLAGRILPSTATEWLLTTWPGRAVGVACLLVLLTPAVYLWLGITFVTQEIAVRDETVIGAITGSWSLVSGRRLRLLALVAVLTIPQLLLSVVVFSQLPTAVAQYVSIPLTTVAAIATMSVMARAYVQMADDPTRALPRDRTRL